MRKESRQSHSRRNVFTGALRWAAAGVLAVFGGAAIAKRRRLYDGKCVNRSVCRSCRIYQRCGLPLALSSKKANARKDNG